MIGVRVRSRHGHRLFFGKAARTYGVRWWSSFWSYRIRPSAHPGLPARQIAAVALGNALEFYDFVTYAFFAAQIGRCFFPAEIPGGSLLASLTTFGAGFLTRPLGALVLGRLGDRVGRKPAMLVSLMLIGVGVIGLPLVPSYATIGIAAPILAIAFRLLQGFALGGEVGPSTAFLMEAAPPPSSGFAALYSIPWGGGCRIDSDASPS